MFDDHTASICVFCGSRPGNHPRYVALAQATGTALAKAGYRLVYGGGGGGLMGATAKAAFEHGGDVLGIMPEFLTAAEQIFKDVPHRIVPDMHERKMQMYDSSNAFIVLPGGIGTLEECVEVMSWMALRLHQKPMVFVSDDQYWDPLLTLFDHTIARGFTSDWLRQDIFTATSIDEALDIIRGVWANPPAQKVDGIIATPSDL